MASGAAVAAPPHPYPHIRISDSAWAPGTADGDLAALLEGVGSITTVGTVGQVSVWGPDGFAVALGDDEGRRAPIIAAGSLGKGRVMAWAHSFASQAAAKERETGRLLVNSAKWLSGNAKPRIAVLGSDVAAYLNEQGVEAVAIKGGDGLAAELAGCSAMFCGNGDVSDRELQAMIAFVRRGGGVACFTCPWGWAQVRKKEVSAQPLNTLLTLAGLAYSDGYSETTTKEGKPGFLTAERPGPEFNAGTALEILAKGSADAKLMRQAGATVVHAVRTMPAQDTILRPRLKELLRGRSAELVPSEKAPLSEKRALDRALIAMQLEELKHQPPEKIAAHPAAAEFPGSVPADALRETVTVEIDTAVKGWRSTGVYAVPGEIITIKVVGKEARGLRVRIGCHQDDLWALKEWKRAPAIDQSWPLEGSARVANAFGGPVYLEVADEAKGNVRVTIAGAVRAPLFVLGETTDDQWKEIRQRPGPWAELACSRVVLSIPSAVARKIENPTAIMEHWVKVLDAAADLAGIPHERKKPERFVADVQISAGYMHSGYPIMTHLDAATFMTDLKGLTDQGWGPYHELGHNHQDDMWTFDGTTEVTCNLFTLYVLETVCGLKDAETGRVLNDDGSRNRARYLAEGAKFEKWKSDPFLALQMYAMVKREFGWEPFKRVLAEYRQIPRGERPRTDDARRDQWMIRLSRAVGRNLGPFFVAWGVPTSEAARAEVAGLPGWMPEEMKSVR